MKLRKFFLVFLLLFITAKVWAADFPSLSFTFSPRQLISSAKIMANYNALLNGIIDGTNKLNIAQLFINSSLVIDNDLDITATNIDLTGTVNEKGELSVSRYSNSLESTIAIATANSSTDYLLIIDNDTTCTTESTLPSNILEIKFNPGKGFSNTATINLTGQYISAITSSNIFKGNGTITGNVSNEKISVDWFGAVPDDTTDSYPGIQAAMDFSKGNNIVGLSGSYLLKTGQLTQGVYDVELDGGSKYQTTIRLDSTASYFTSASREMFITSVPTAKFDNTDTYIVTSNVDLGGDYGVEVGDLIEFRGVASFVEIRKVGKISGTTIYFDCSLYQLDNYDGVNSIRIRVFPPIDTTIRNITWDLDDWDQGHAGITGRKSAYSLVENCDFITGGQHAVYFYESHSMNFKNNRAWEFTKRTSGWQPERAGEAYIDASLSNLAGEGYGFAFAGHEGLAENNMVYRSRHAVAGGGAGASHLIYQNNFSYSDLQGAYDFHYGVIHSKCIDNVATNGWAGGWIRGNYLTIKDNDFFDLNDGLRIFEQSGDIYVEDNNIDECTYGVRLFNDNGVTQNNIYIEGNTIRNMRSNVVFAKSNSANPGLQQYNNIHIKNNKFIDGKPVIDLYDKYDIIKIENNTWTGTLTTTSPNSLIRFFPSANITNSVRNISVKDNYTNLVSTDVGVLLNLTRIEGSLGDNVFTNLIFTKNNHNVDGTSQGNGMLSINNSAVIGGLYSNKYNTFNDVLYSEDVERGANPTYEQENTSESQFSACRISMTNEETVSANRFDIFLEKLSAGAATGYSDLKIRKRNTASDLVDYMSFGGEDNEIVFFPLELGTETRGQVRIQSANLVSASGNISLLSGDLLVKGDSSIVTGNFQINEGDIILEDGDIRVDGTITVNVGDLVVSDGDIITEDWVDYSSYTTPTGWSSVTDEDIYVRKVGKLLHIQYYVGGTSNSTSTVLSLANLNIEDQISTYKNTAIAQGLDNSAGAFFIVEAINVGSNLELRHYLADTSGAILAAANCTASNDKFVYNTLTLVLD